MANLGKIPPEVLEEIKRRTDLAAKVGEHVRLKRAGARLLGLCPFHEERTPSFNVRPDKNLFHCFGCGEGGDVFAFLGKIQKKTFIQVVEELAAAAGVDLSPFRRRGEDAPDYAAWAAANAAAAEFFRAQVKRHPLAEAYLKERGLDPATQDVFGIGFAPDEWSALLDHLKAKGFKPELLFELGLVRKRQGGNGFYDVFRRRLMFPIRDDSGRVIAFGGRRIGDGDEAKYMNSPEGPLYVKGNHLYNFDRCRPLLAADRSARPVLCEGYMDVIALHRAGLPAAVGNLGTALTPVQAKKLAQASTRWVLCYDADAAGMKAAVRAVQLLDPLGVELRVMALAGKDPDELLSTEGPEAVLAAHRDAGPVDAFVFEAVAKGHDLADPRGRSEAFRALKEVFLKLENPVTKEELIRRVADGLSLGEDLVRQAFRAGAHAPAALAGPARERGEQSPDVLAERALLRELLSEVAYWKGGPAAGFVPARARDPWVKLALLKLGELELTEGPAWSALSAHLEDEDLKRFLRTLELSEAAETGPEARRHVEELVTQLDLWEAERRVGELEKAIAASREPADRRARMQEFVAAQAALRAAKERRALASERRRPPLDAPLPGAPGGP